MTATMPAKGRGLSFTTSWGLIVKIVLLCLLNALVLAQLPTMIDKPDWAFVIVSVVALLAINVVYLSPRRFIPGKYLLPGTLFLLVFVAYPVGYTMYNAFTNYGTGNNLSKSQAIEIIENNSIGSTADAQRYDLQVLAQGSDTGPIAFLLTDDEGAVSLGTATGLVPIAPEDVIQDGRRLTVEGYVALNAGKANARKLDVEALKVPGPQGEISNDGFGAAFAQVQTRIYDPATNTVTDSSKNTVYSEKDGAFVSAEGERLDPGWRAFIGTKNFERIATQENIRDPFIRAFIWTFIFAVGTVLLQFALGLLVAMVMNHERMRGKKIYRSLLIIPYALPSFMTSLVWRGMLNQEYGVVNRMFGLNVPWLDGQWMPYFSILLVGTWLGFSYWFLICTGALTSIPSELKEAAFVDGASGAQAFRRVTFPLLLVSTAPVLIASFAFNFNNFNLIFLLTEGKPPISGSDAGRTDILITYMWKVAFYGGRGADYGFASALAIVNFFLVIVITTLSFRRTKTFEEVR
jgi:arabinogalactan oligomer / maltooligosaccharide transport system permease protein